LDKLEYPSISSLSPTLQERYSLQEHFDLPYSPQEPIVSFSSSFFVALLDSINTAPTLTNALKTNMCFPQLDYPLKNDTFVHGQRI
jgi:hypothetical protein